MSYKNYTYLDLNEWTKSIFDNFGKIVLEKHYDNYEKVDLYKNNIDDLKENLQFKIKKLKIKILKMI